MLHVLVAAMIAFSLTRADDPSRRGRRPRTSWPKGWRRPKRTGKPCSWRSARRRAGGANTWTSSTSARPSPSCWASHLVFVKVDVVDNPGGEKLYDRYAPSQGGVPIWVFLSADGKVLGDSFEDAKGKKQNMGFPYEPNELVHYEKTLRAAARS